MSCGAAAPRAHPEKITSSNLKMAPTFYTRFPITPTLHDKILDLTGSLSKWIPLVVQPETLKQLLKSIE